MEKQNRRQAMASLSALALAGCGGGGEDTVATTAPTGAGSAATREQAQALVPGTTSDTLQQYLLWDGGSGPSRDYWNTHLELFWKNRPVGYWNSRPTGDWLDANGVSQGTAPFCTALVSATGYCSIDVSTLVAQWLRTGKNKGAFLRGRSKTASAYAQWSGRLSAEAQRPQLDIVTAVEVTGADGQTRLEERTYSWNTGTLAGYNPGSYRSVDTTLGYRHTPVCPAFVQFPLHEQQIEGTFKRAVMRLYCEATAYNFNVDVYEIDAPYIHIGSDGYTGEQAPRLGLAATLGEAGLKSHPSVLRAGDFSNLQRGVVFDEVSCDSRNPYETPPDADAPGTVMLRGQFTPASCASFHARVETMRADLGDPRRPLPDPAVKPITEELYCRVYFYLEDDWNSARDYNKMAIGWDLRFGWWNNNTGGYWYSTSGNGGRRATGTKALMPAGTYQGYQLPEHWEYEGQSSRLVAGKAPLDQNPYRYLRPLQNYMYHLDQAVMTGDILRMGNAVISKNRWFCIEQRIKINSIDLTTTDQYGNGTAIRDGELDTWLDGVLVEKQSNKAWRCHPDMGIDGPWIAWYFGGHYPSDMVMHYRMNHFVLAREYIGPRVG